MCFVVCKESDESSNKEDNQQEGHGSSDSQSQVEMGRPFGKQGTSADGYRIHILYMVRRNKQRELGDCRPDGQKRPRG